MRWTVLALFFALAWGMIPTVDNENYVPILRNTTRHRLAIACVDGSRRDQAVTFMVAWAEIAGQFQNETEFAYCNSFDADMLLQTLAVERLPALIMISDGNVYQVYGEKKFSDMDFVMKFIRNYRTLRDKVAPLPSDLYDVSAVEAVVSPDHLSSIWKEGLEKFVWGKIEFVFGGKCAKCWAILIMGLPVAVGVVFAVLGLVLERTAASKEEIHTGAKKEAGKVTAETTEEKKDDKGTKSKKRKQKDE